MKLNAFWVDQIELNHFEGLVVSIHHQPFVGTINKREHNRVAPY